MEISAGHLSSMKKGHKLDEDVTDETETTAEKKPTFLFVCLVTLPKREGAGTDLFQGLCCLCTCA